MQKNHDCTSEFSVADIKNDSIKQVFQLLAEGETKLCHQPKIEEATLLLGNTGVGKSVLTRRIAGYGGTLKSVLNRVDYTIVDINSKDNEKSFVTSNTIFPELLQNNTTSAAYYDFPGFLDTRGTAIDISTTYFMKKTADNAKRVKILILANHASLTNLGTRDDFTTLLHHVTKFVKNIDKYKDGIALIATKVQYFRIKDDKIVSSIAKFIANVKLELGKQQLKGLADNSNAIKLLDILLQQDGHKYPKIGISRSPDEEGLMSEIPKIKENTQNIETMLAKLKFVQTNESDFGYILSKKSLADIPNILNEINLGITANVREISKEMQKILSTGENGSFDFDKVTKIKEKASNHKDLEKCLQEVVRGAVSMNISSVHENTLKKLGHYSSIIRQVGNQTSQNEFKCADGLEEVVEYSTSIKWNEFVNKLYERLSHYEIQRDTRKNPCTTFADNVAEAIDDEKAELKLDPVVLEECYPNYKPEFEGIEKIKVDEPKLKTLEKMLRITLKSILTYSCDTNKLAVRGQYVKLSEVLSIQQKNCKEPKFIEILALNDVFIDTNLNKTGEEVQLAIVAPKWNIQGTKKITLEGKPGEAHKPTKAKFGNPGSDGLPGLPGGPGGNFLGIGETFMNLQGLTVSVKGGKGGPGQDGGDGGKGRDGANAWNDVFVKKNIGHQIVTYGSIGLASIGKVESKNHSIINYRESISYYEVTIAGKDGEKGGNGGDGGVGGLGGNSGKIIFTPLSNSASNHLRSGTGIGNDGSDGKGGEGGAGGKRGNDLLVEKPLLAGVYRNDTEKVIYKDERAKSGDRGIDGRNSKQQTNPLPRKKLLNIPDIMNDYKKYAMENLHQSMNESYTMEFLHKMENDERLKNQPQRRRRFIDQGNQTQTIDHENVPATSNFKTSRILMALEPGTSNADNASAKSAAARINSPINFAVKLVSSFIGQLSLFGSASILNYGLVRGGIESMFRDSKPSDIHTTAKENTNHTIQLGNFNINESLTLANFAIRCITKEKFYSSEEKLMILTEVKALVLNIITEFEKILSDLCVQYNLPPESLEFDPVTLISKLEKEIINQNYKKMGNVLYQSVEGSFRSNNPQFHAHLLQKIDEILVSRNNADLEDHQINSDHLQSNRSSNVIGMENCNKCNVYQLEMNNFQSFAEIGS
ncbi:uncharacterized protein LOC135837494 [Planococcus citri]|uniref:uncharacterized protein LOC135837494 n=1 Tax=Planococcus citri TaxID=170843 RepID=UPI0031F88445